MRSRPRVAREGLKDAVELYIAYLLEAGERAAISRSVPREAIAEFRSEAREAFAVERHTLVQRRGAVTDDV